MDFEIRAPDDSTTTGWQNLAYSSQVGTCSSTCTEETWASAYGYTFCPQEGAYDARTRAYTNAQWETSDWQASIYSVTWDTSSDWCTCITSDSQNWFSTVSGGTGGNCCGDDGASDDFYYYTASPTTATSLSCTRCLDGTKSSPATLYGNGYWSGTNTATDTSGTCYTGDITCNSTTASNGSSAAYYGNGYWSGSSPATDTSGTCYYGDISCANGSASHGTSGTYVGNGYTTDSPTTDKNGLCYYTDITCIDGSAANSATTTIHGNGYLSGTTCYYGDWTCANETAANGANCTLACSGLGTTCCPAQNTYRDTMTCTEAGCGYTDHDRDSGQSYCASTAIGCTAYTWDSLGSKCCGDDGSGDSFCTAAGGSCISGTWSANHCSDSAKNCDEERYDCGGSDCAVCPADSVAPITSHDANQDWQAANQVITLACSDPGSGQAVSGCANTYYCIDDSNTCNPTTAGTEIQINCGSGEVNKEYARFYSVDNNSNSESVNGVYIRIDKQKPSTATDVPSGWREENTTITLSCSDGNGIGCSATYYKTDSNPSMDTNFGAWQTYSSGVVFSSDGNYTIQYYSADGLGNTETTKTALVLLDKNFLSVGLEDSNATYSDYNGVIIIPITTDGNHQIDYNSTDALGNVEQIRVGWAALDKTAPSTTDDLNAEWQNQNISIALSCSDSASGCSATQYRLDSNGHSGTSMGSWQAYSSAISITSDGNWALDYNSRDIAGRTETTHRVYALLDKTTPSVSHDANTEWVNSDQAVTLTPSDSTSGISATYYCVDTANTCTPSTSGTSVSVTCTSNSVCQKYARYYSKDNAGNQSDTNSVLVRIDKEHPSTSDDANTLCRNTDQNITLSPTDASGSGLTGTYYCTDTANSCAPTASGTSVNVTCAAGSYCQKYARYYSKDNAGNSETTKSVLTTIDKATPTTSDDANTQWQGSNQIVALSPSDTGCGVTATYYCIDSGNICTPSTSGTSVSVSCDSDSVCQKYVRYYSIDSAGNTESTKSVLVKIDRQPPTTQHDANIAWQPSDQTVTFTINDSSGAGGDSAYYCVDDS
ncbi:MAG: hypothetical protein JRD89_10665, partial [Deltaproteobacteria bacterium]|nr:hypothetical protein [Deltaproteobacteria bacterium]